VLGILLAAAVPPNPCAGQDPGPVRSAASGEPLAPAADAERQRIDAAADRGLAWLAERQLASGAWAAGVGHKQNYDYMLLGVGLSLDRQRASGHGHPGVTALCGMAFLGGGHIPDRGPYGAHVRRTLDYMLGCVQENGFITDSGTRMYSHAFATLFLAEVHGMCGHRRDETRRALERAVQLIVDCQNPYGAWRYNTFDKNADLSVTVCQLQALRAARNIGIHVPKGTVDRAVEYVLASRTPRGRDAGLFYYKIYGTGARRKNTQYAINAAGITALNSAGIYNQDLTGPALRWLDREYGQMVDYASDHYTFWYGNYYACQAFFTAGGDVFETWWRGAAQDLVRLQQADGHWVNRVGPGDEFSTAVACIVLQVPRQYLPIFQR